MLHLNKQRKCRKILAHKVTMMRREICKADVFSHVNEDGEMKSID